MIREEDAQFVINPPADDADFELKDIRDANPISQTQPTPEEISNLRGYIESIANKDTNLTLDAVVKKLADQWRAAAWKIATAMRQELLRQNWLKEADWHTKELTTTQLVEIGRNYGIPFCIYHLGATNDSGHYVILTSVPEKKSPSDSNHTIHAYDPIRGKIELNLTESELTRAGKLTISTVHPKPIGFGIHGMEFILAQIKQIIAETNGYDLNVPRYDDLEELSLAKMQPLQNKDGFNCGLWCLIYAMTTMAYKRGENIFKKMGIKKIADLCQVALVTPETD